MPPPWLLGTPRRWAMTSLTSMPSEPQRNQGIPSGLPLSAPMAIPFSSLTPLAPSLSTSPKHSVPLGGH